MPLVTLEFNDPLNVSVQPGDVIYQCRTVNRQAGRNHFSYGTNTKPGRYGVVKTVDHVDFKIDVNAEQSVVLDQTRYISFSKDKRVNTSGIIGYFAEVEFRNYTTLPAEIFATAVDYVESSK